MEIEMPGRASGPSGGIIMTDPEYADRRSNEPLVPEV
jgi:hypothetical protein